MACWLMKSEPDAFSIDALRRKRTAPWDGVRNYQARNFIRRMRPGDQAFFYHSSCPEPGVYGLMRIASDPYPDPTQFNRRSPYFDAASTREQPRWSLVDVAYERHLRRPVLLSQLRAEAARLRGLQLLVPGSRLSVMPVTPPHWRQILALESG